MNEIKELLRIMNNNSDDAIDYFFYSLRAKTEKDRRYFEKMSRQANLTFIEAAKEVLKVCQGKQ